MIYIIETRAEMMTNIDLQERRTNPQVWALSQSELSGIAASYLLSDTYNRKTEPTDVSRSRQGRPENAFFCLM